VKVRRGGQLLGFCGGSENAIEKYSLCVCWKRNVLAEMNSFFAPNRVGLTWTEAWVLSKYCLECSYKLLAKLDKLLVRRERHDCYTEV
jgi:hypothetical protein